MRNLFPGYSGSVLCQSAFSDNRTKHALRVLLVRVRRQMETQSFPPALCFRVISNDLSLICGIRSDSQITMHFTATGSRRNHTCFPGKTHILYHNHPPLAMQRLFFPFLWAMLPVQYTAEFITGTPETYQCTIPLRTAVNLFSDAVFPCSSSFHGCP